MRLFVRPIHIVGNLLECRIYDRFEARPNNFWLEVDLIGSVAVTFGQSYSTRIMKIGCLEVPKASYPPYFDQLSERCQPLCNISKMFYQAHTFLHFIPHVWLYRWQDYNMNVSGLTFQTAADARAFDKGVKLAVEDIHAGDLLHSFSLNFSNFHSFSLLPLTISLTHTLAE